MESKLDSGAKVDRHRRHDESILNALNCNLFVIATLGPRGKGSVAQRNDLDLRFGASDLRLFGMAASSVETAGVFGDYGPRGPRRRTGVADNLALVER